MDFGTLLHVAKKNSEAGKTESKYYSTKFAPPKKESKEKKLSENIQRFLQKREQEEKERQRQEREKLTNLLAMRDQKSKNKIKKMLKVTKSANKSVLDDAINTEHTAITMQGPEQADQDDYGYVSTEANAFYHKYIEKVKDVKEDKGFAPSRPQPIRDLSGTKERVKAAITREIEEKKNHSRQRSSSSAPATTTTATATTTNEITKTTARAPSSLKNLYDPEADRLEEDRKKREEEKRKAKNRKPLPPPMDFQALLKLAEKKQHEPVEIVVEEKKEPERLLTSKEKRELEERLREREARERRKREANSSFSGYGETDSRIPKVNQTKRPGSGAASSTVTKSGSSSSTTKSSSGASNKAPDVKNGFKKPPNPPNSSRACMSLQSIKQPTNNSSTAKGVPKANVASAPKKPPCPSSLQARTSVAAGSSSNKAAVSSTECGRKTQGGATRELPRDLKSIKPRQFPPPDLQKARQFPTADVRREPGGKGGLSRKPQVAQKRRILDDEDEDEYDSELDDFIDDGDCEEDYSSHIKAIFGYDKSRYRDVDDEDDSVMESNFAQVQREEYISKKIGLQEDLEDMKLEAAEKKRKMMMKKRKL